ncbi:hypothetical protein ACFYWX_05640 [Streptomyces sp. NPDC002888]|uniref:hypothetical protein n=1 Tax=Streptomyces sp. NPDC002888 TaxID=3364668 RepID=UPI0036B4CF56
MDPAVTAALITTPTAILAAAAAYAAGSAQRRGSVDAVRRQQQREVYAAFLTAARRHKADIAEALAHATEIQLARAAGEPLSPAEEEQRREAIAATARANPLDEPAALVFLEGPDELAYAALLIDQHAKSTRMLLTATPEHAGTMSRIHGRPMTVHDECRRLEGAIHRFTLEAQAHMNGTALRHRRHQRRLMRRLWPVEP